MNFAVREAQLVEWLQQAQRERDQAKQGLAAVEAQKATLVEWLQNAQHERDDARQERDRLQKQIQAQQSHHPMQYYPLPATPSVAEECVKLAQRLADLHPGIVRSDQAEMEQIRSIMNGLSCGGGASTK